MKMMNDYEDEEMIGFEQKLGGIRQINMEREDESGFS